MFQTDSDEDVIFVYEKCARKSNEITFDQAKRLALQRDIDQESQPKQISKPLRSVAVERRVEQVKMKMEEEKSDENCVKKERKLKKGQVSMPKNKNCAVDENLTEIPKEKKKKGKKVDAVVIDIEEESWDGGGKNEEKKRKKKKIINESLNDAGGADVKNENDEEVSRKKKRKLFDSENHMETVQSSMKEEGGKKQRKEKKVKNTSAQTKSENVKTEEEEEEEEKQHDGKDKLPKRDKKRKNNTFVVSTEESEKQVNEKKKKKSPNEETTEAMEEISVIKKKNKAGKKVAENDVKLETPDGETGEVEKVIKRKRVKKSLKKRLKEKRLEDGNVVGTPHIEGNSKRSEMETEDMLNKKKDKSIKSEIVIIEEGETELKSKRKKEKGRKVSVDVSEAEKTEPKNKKSKKGSSEGEEGELVSLKCEDVEEKSTETLVTLAGDTKRKETKKISIKVEKVSFETGAKKKKKKKIKEEVEDQHESSQVDVVFLSEKSGNTDEVNIDQERRQALQMEIDQASQPQKPAKLTGLGQWGTAQFDSSDQQQKFLRLMGGFKKGFQPASGSTGRTNMALGKYAEQQLQQGLLGEFERAHSRKVDFNNRGAGLGFTAPSNKKFSIDINACHSVRFDD